MFNNSKITIPKHSDVRDANLRAIEAACMQETQTSKRLNREIFGCPDGKNSGCPKPGNLKRFTFPRLKFLEIEHAKSLDVFRRNGLNIGVSGRPASKKLKIKGIQTSGILEILHS